MLLRSLDAEQSQETKQSGSYLEEFKFFLCANCIIFKLFFGAVTMLPYFFQRSEIHYLRELLEQCDLCSPGKKLQ